MYSNSTFSRRQTRWFERLRYDSEGRGYVYAYENHLYRPNRVKTEGRTKYLKRNVSGCDGSAKLVDGLLYIGVCINRQLAVTVYHGHVFSLALSTLATPCRYVHSCIFHTPFLVFYRAALSTPANSINPCEHANSANAIHAHSACASIAISLLG